MKLNDYFKMVLKVAFSKATKEIKYRELQNSIALSIDPTLTVFIEKQDFLLDIDKLKNRLNINYLVESEFLIDEDDLVEMMATNKIVLYEAVEYKIFKPVDKSDNSIALVERKALSLFDTDCVFKADKKKTEIYIYLKNIL